VDPRVRERFEELALELPDLLRTCNKQARQVQILAMRERGRERAREGARARERERGSKRERVRESGDGPPRVRETRAAGA